MNSKTYEFLILCVYAALIIVNTLVYRSNFIMRENSDYLYVWVCTSILCMVSIDMWMFSLMKKIKTEKSMKQIASSGVFIGLCILISLLILGGFQYIMPMYGYEALPVASMIGILGCSLGLFLYLKLKLTHIVI